MVFFSCCYAITVLSSCLYLIKIWSTLSFAEKIGGCLTVFVPLTNILIAWFWYELVELPSSRKEKYMLSNQLGSMRLMHLSFVRRYVPEIISGELKLTFYNGNPFLINPSNNCVYDFEWYSPNDEDSDEFNYTSIVNDLVIKCEMFKWWVEPHNIITHELFEEEVNDFMYAYWEQNKSD